MSSQLDQGFGTYLNNNAAVLPAFSAVVIAAPNAVDLTPDGGAGVFGVTQEDVAIGGYGLVKLKSAPGTFMLATAVATVAGTAYSLNASGQVVAIGSSPENVNRVIAVNTAASGVVAEFYFA